MKRRNEIKINFTWKGLKFKNISITYYEQTGKKYYYASMKGVSSVIRQYIKQKYDVPFQIKSDTFSGGDSINVYFNPMYVTQTMYDVISKDLAHFQAGTFDGMTDSYNYKSTHHISGFVEGQKITFDTTYLHTQYRPRYGTKEYAKFESDSSHN